MSDVRDVVVIGGGQAGLSMSYCLKQRGVDHVVLERHAPGHEWREHRWDTFCLVTPNWQCQLPGFPYDGDDPHGFMGREAIVGYLEAYVASFEPPLIEGVEVTALRSGTRSRFELETSTGAIGAEQVVLATGGYHTPKVPRLAERLPAGIDQLHTSDYRRPSALADGAVLVVGTGQSGCQIAEDLHLEGREVHLALGSATRTARFYRGRDVVDWLSDLGQYDVPVTEHPSGTGVRAKANQYVTGRDGGRDIDLRAFARDGMELYGRPTGVDDAGRLAFAPDLTERLDKADASSEAIKDLIDEHIESEGLTVPEEARYEAVWAPEGEPASLDLEAAGVTTVIWATGFARDDRWIELPAFDGRGYPSHHRGVTSVPGLSVIGLPWLHTWGSGRFSGVARDADHLAERVARAVGRPSAVAA